MPGSQSVRSRRDVRLTNPAARASSFRRAPPCCMQTAAVSSPGTQRQPLWHAQSACTCHTGHHMTPRRNTPDAELPQRCPARGQLSESAAGSLQHIILCWLAKHRPCTARAFVSSCQPAVVPEMCGQCRNTGVLSELMKLSIPDESQLFRAQSGRLNASGGSPGTPCLAVAVTMQSAAAVPDAAGVCLSDGSNVAGRI